MDVAVVIDSGSAVIKAGFSGEDRPKCAFGNIVGRPKHRRVMAGGALEGSLHVGVKTEEHRGALVLHHPMSHGVVTDWDEMNAVWRHAYEAGNLDVPSEDHAVLITDAPGNPRSHREKLADAWFSVHNVPALHIAAAPTLALYASGKTTGIVVDVGDGVSSVTPVYEGFAVQSAVTRSDIGGRDVTMQLIWHLRHSGRSFHTTAEAETARLMKEAVCYVSQDPDADEAAVREGRFAAGSAAGSSGTAAVASAGAAASTGGAATATTAAGSAASSGSAEYVLPDGHRLVVGAERFRASEVLFRPSLLGLEYPGIGEAVSTSVLKCDLELRRTLLGNVVLAGGSTALPGFGSRLLKEVRKLTPADTHVKVLAAKERKVTSWIGGAILASLSTFRGLCVTKRQWEEEGPRCIASASVGAL